ncbi:hypothetical protein SAMN02745119_00564 [Trichlorobacter thiogenes]|uniref:Uncharacterized protein n=1 Tax=Trichlorobacter thiogenes TaxID=115783 RepID=A0A1T4KHY2_9BACT|nr:hypothetical protein [Trichlorobacter thiogenes]SJZ42014.1 hypothetical protein SAMN02745119_00564 [Trichlorobacter thiogenes]
MQKNEAYFAAIAERLRNEHLPEIPIQHEWLELSTLLSQMESPHLREIGLNELARHARQEANFRHAGSSKSISTH